MSDHVDCIVIGAGVIGLAVARGLAVGGREVIVLEAEPAIGTGISARNSEVIHAGIYYPTGSLKAALCVRGKRLLYAYCADHHVAHRRLGKLIVAVDEDELTTLATIRAKAAENGVTDLEFLDAEAVRTLEPNLNAAGALLSPSTGIVDAHGLMLSLQGEAEERGAVVALASPVIAGRVLRERGGEGKLVLDVGGDAATTVTCNTLINCAGLDAQAVAHRLAGLDPATIPPARVAKGSYFTLSGAAPFNRLIYPVPVRGGLGTHSTLDLGGQTKFGPDVEWLEPHDCAARDERDYDVDPARAEQFYTAVRRYWPELPDGALVPGYAGLRPKLAGPQGGPWGSDFVIQGPRAHGIDGLVNLYGIESPGLTSCLAIAERVAALI